MKNALEIRNLTKTFDGFWLNDLTLTLPSGCIMGLIGENGAGKSTTIRLILGMLKKDSGEIHILGQDAGDEITELKEEIGVVLDDVGIPDCLTPKQVGKIMRHTFRKWDDDTYMKYLRKLSVPSDKKFKDFSKGMKMKLGIAVALSHDPKLLLFDEATSGLDPVARDDVIEILMDFTRDEEHSVLISSHIVSDLEKVCDYIAFLHDGKLMLCEEKDRIVSEYGVIHCTPDQFNKLNPASIVHKKQNAYGVEAIVMRSSVPVDLEIRPVDIEDLFVQMVREAR